MPDGKIGVIECLFAANPLDRVEVQHLSEQIDGERVCAGI